VKTLFVAYRVTDLERSLEFYTTLGYVDLGRVEVGGFDHLAIQVDDLMTTLELLRGNGLEAGPLELPAGDDGPRTAWLTDPDGYRIELVEWPPGHPDGITAADFPEGKQN
jgi:lactoylglutathione lyase